MGVYKVDASGGGATYVAEYGRYVDSLDMPEDERRKWKEGFGLLPRDRQFSILMGIWQDQQQRESDAFGVCQEGLGVLGPGIPGGK